MRRKHGVMIGVAGLILIGGLTTGVVMADSGSGLPTSVSALASSGRMTEGQATARVAIIQVLDGWAQNWSAGNSEATALFTPSASINLFYSETATTPFTLVPTGYSPSATPTGGTAGGGCTVSGSSSISDFFAGQASAGFGVGQTTNEEPTNFRDYVMDPVVSVAPDGETAVAQSYLESYNGNAQGGRLLDETLLQTKLRWSQSTGWNIDEMNMVFESPQPNYPCED